MSVQPNAVEGSESDTQKADNDVATRLPKIPKHKKTIIIVVLSVLLVVLLATIIGMAIALVPALQFSSVDDVCTTHRCLETAAQLLETMNQTVNPCEDFYQFACGQWSQRKQFLPAVHRTNRFDIRETEIVTVTQEILTAPYNHLDHKPLQQAKAMYKLCVGFDRNRITKNYTRFAEPEWPSVGGNVNIFNFTDFLIKFGMTHKDIPIISVSVAPDDQDNHSRIIIIDQPKFLIKRSVLIGQGNESKRKLINEYKACYVEDAKNFLKQLKGETSPTPPDEDLKEDAGKVIEFETALARFSSSDSDRLNFTRMYNKMTVEEFESSYSNLPLTELLQGIFAETDIIITAAEPLIVKELDYFKGLNKALTKNLTGNVQRNLANYLHWRLVDRVINPEATEYGRGQRCKGSSGQGTPSSREATCARLVLNNFGMAIGTKYIDKAFDNSDKTYLENMVENLQKSFREMLNHNDWMDNETKFYAARKADAIISHIAYPDWISNKTAVESLYAGYEIQDEDYLGSLIAWSKWGVGKNLKSLRTPINKNIWKAHPSDVNGFYTPQLNSITFPAGVLQPPFYHSGGLECVNYGAIGTIIGHEITHGFDPEGSQYDPYGKRKDWWSPEAKKNFENRTQCIIDQYSKFKTPDGINVHGIRTQGENVADNGGLREAYGAYINWIQNSNGGQPEKRLPGLEQYSPEQLFFLSFANLWCSDQTDQRQEYLNTDKHSPSEFRVLGTLQNSVDFAENWNCPAGSPMNPGNKCVVW